MTRRQFQLVWALLVLVTLAVVVGGVAIGVAAHETSARERQDRMIQQQRQADMCQLVRLFDVGAAPSNDRARQVADGLHRYLQRNCS